MAVETIRWKKDKVELIDQRLLPGKLKYVNCTTSKDIWKAIKDMQVRGAPAIGVAGAYGLYLGVRNVRTQDIKTFKKKVYEVINYLAGSRPTARNLFWGLERIKHLVDKNSNKSVEIIKELILEEANKILKEDKRICRKIGSNGKKLLKTGSRVLTHCNAGGLATADYGTALGVMFAAAKKIKMVYVDETRPVLQGARLTAWELVQEGIPATLICDNMAASIMAKGKIDAVIVGADRISANGDTANKIGTYNVAILAKYHKVPFYVAAPVSTFDLSLRSGKSIPIEERSPLEVKKINGKYITVKNISVENPAFDVTPAALITAIITEKGVIKKPNRKKVTKVIRS